MREWKGYQKGINLGGWLSQCIHTKEHYDSFINKDDIIKIASWGADHVRLPIDYNLVEDTAGCEQKEGYRYIDNALEWCKEAGLNLVLDLHKTAGFSFDKGECENGFFENPVLQERFYCLWERLAQRYASYGDRIAFELLNEVTEQHYGGIWNHIILHCVKRIRAYAPDTVIIVGGYWNNSPEALPDLAAPYDDKVVLSFHCYDPLDFTHQGAHWVEGMDTAFRMRFPESEVTPSYFAGRFAKALDTAKKYDAVLYCGEYGVIDNAEPEDRLKWYKVINSAFLQFGISRCTWNYKQKDFGLSDDCMHSVIDELIAYL